MAAAAAAALQSPVGSDPPPRFATRFSMDSPHRRRMRALSTALTPDPAPAARFLHTMIRVTELDKTLKFFAILGLTVQSESPSEHGRFTNIFLSTGHETDATLELTHNWDGEDPNKMDPTGDRKFGHVALAVDDVRLCI